MNSQAQTRRRALRRAVIALAVTYLTAGTMPHCLAADKNGVSPKVVTLPSGPGSIQGLGEEFSPEPGSGTASYGFDIEVPPGTCELAPDISLSYEGGSGNGPLGFGWSLEMPYIQRRTELQLPRYVDADNGIDDDGDGEVDEPDERDRFVNEDAKILVPQADGFYFCHEQEDFVRYHRKEGGWHAGEPDGVELEFGMTPQARVPHPDTGDVFAWKLERTIDVTDNEIRYSYVTFPGEENLNQSYITKIEYGPGAPPWDNFHFVVFRYEPRPDGFENGRAGFIQRTGMRLKEIIVGTQGPVLSGLGGIRHWERAQGDFNDDGVPDYLNRKYVLAYEGHPHWSLLTSITQIGADGISALPPMTMTYTACAPPPILSAEGGMLASLNTPLQLMTSDWVELTELNGDGLPDLLRTDPAGGPHFAYFNRGETAGPPRAIQWSSAVEIGGDQRAWSVNLSENAPVTAYLADMNADGRSDLVYQTLQEVCYFAHQADAGMVRWEERTRMNLHAGTSAPPAPFDNDDVASDDVNGDKKQDIIQSVSTGGRADYRIWYNLGGQRFSKSFTVSSEHTLMLSGNGVELTDFNGDDLSDLVRIRPTRLEVCAGLGYGRFAAPVIVEIPDYTLDVARLEDTALEDVNGDGLPDLLIERAAPGELWYWLNLGNNRLDSRRIITGLPASMGTNVAVRWADLNGNGTTDLIYADNFSESRLQIVDVGELMGCVPAPNLLTSIKNGIGRTIQITYASSIAFSLEDAAAGAPWPYPMPISTEVVSEIAVDDSLGNVYKTQLAYHDGYYHPERQEFTGFARTVETQIGDADAPTLITRSWFDVGREVFAMRGKLLRQTTENEEGSVFWDETTEWTPRVLMVGTDGEKVIFPEMTSQARLILEGNTGTPRRIETAYEHDAYGNEIVRREFGIVEDGNPYAGNDERITIREYAYNLDDWLVEYPIREEVRNGAGETISLTETYYDEETFSAANYGEVIYGGITLLRKWPNPEQPDAYIDEQRVQYEEYGSPAIFLDALAVAEDGEIQEDAGHYRIITFDPVFRACPVLETIYLGGGREPLVIEVRHDAGLGVVTSSSNFNGHQTFYSYDPFGRLISSVRPGDTPELPTLEYEYALAQPWGESGLINYVETRLLDRAPGEAGGNRRDHYFIGRGYVSGLGEILLEKEEAEPDPVSGEARAAIKSASLYTARRTPAYALQSCFTTLSGAGLDALLAFEDVAASGWQGVFEIEGASAVLEFDAAPKYAYRYDALLRQTQMISPDGATRSTIHEPLSTIQYDENDTAPDSPFHDTPNIYFMDGLERTVQVDEVVRLNDDGTPSETPAVWTTRYEYRADGALLRITDAQGNQKWMEYDGMGRRVAMHDPNRGEARYAYDGASNLTETIDARGQRISFTYDNANRVLTEDYHDEGLSFSGNYAYDPSLPLSAANRADVVYFYDEPAGALDFGNGETGEAENTRGALASVWDLSGEYHASFDARGRLVWALNLAKDPVHKQHIPYRTVMAYDMQDRVVALTYPDGDQCAYEHGARGLLQRISGGAPMNRMGLNFLLRVNAYSAARQRIDAEHGDSVRSAYTHDARGRLTRITASLPDAPDAPLMDYRYEYDNTSNITAIRDLRPAASHPEDNALRNSQFFEHDDKYRIIRAHIALNTPETPERDDGHIAYRYDRIGNLLSKTSDIIHDEAGHSLTNLGDMAYGGALGAWNRIGRTTPDAGPHALTSASQGGATRAFGYDANGNMTTIDGLQCAFDFKDRLVAVENAAMRAEYTYNYEGRRVAKTVWNKDAAGILEETPSSVTQYITRYFEIRDFGEVTKYILDGDDRIAKVTGTLSPSASRTQWFRLAQGWNLLALALTAPDMAAQLNLGGDIIEAAFLWDAAAEEFIPVTETDPLPEDAILWVMSKQEATLSLTGKYQLPAKQPVPLQTGYFAVRLLDTLSLDRILPEGVAMAWRFDAASQSWQARLSGDLAALSDLPGLLPAGAPIYISLASAATLTPPPAANGIQYYHQDHLGSSNVVTNGAGETVEETVYYPFGAIRAQRRAEDARRNPYLFGGKERDAETGLYYFESRYLAASLCRFNQVDSAAEEIPPAALLDPQLLNAYSFARNNPVVFTDPDGQFIRTAAGKALMRQFNPFSDQATGNYSDTRAERRARVFGELKVEKGGSLPKGATVGSGSIPIFAMKEIDKLRLEYSNKPNQLISAVSKIVEDMAKKQPGGKKSALDTKQFLDAVLSPVDKSDAAQQKRLDLMGELLKSGDYRNSPVTATGKNVNAAATAGIERLLNTMKMIDMNAKYKELAGIAEKSLKDRAFSYKQDEVNKFIDKFMDLKKDVEDPNRDKQDEQE